MINKLRNRESGIFNQKENKFGIIQNLNLFYYKIKNQGIYRLGGKKTVFRISQIIKICSLVLLPKSLYNYGTLILEALLINFPLWNFEF